MDPKRIVELRAHYATLTTDLARAEAEAEVLNEIRRDSPEMLSEHHSTRRAVGKVLDVSDSAVELRRTILLSGDLGDLLWPLVDNGDLPLRTATLLLRRAKSIRVRPETTAAALKRAIAEHYALPNTRTLPDGKVVRLGVPARRGAHKSEPPTEEEEDNVSPPPVVHERTSTSPSQRHEDFWRQLRSICSEYVTKQVPDCDAERMDPELHRLETDLKVVFAQFSARIRNLAKETPLRTLITRRQLQDACQALMIDPPKDIRRVPPDFFSKAQRQFRNLARQYHPDTSAGKDATRPQFEAVMAAWRVLERFQESGALQGA